MAISGRNRETLDAALVELESSVLAMARVMASELSSRSICVSVVTPGSPATPIWNAVGNHEERQLILDKSKRQLLWAGQVTLWTLQTQPCSWRRMNHPSFKAERL